MEPLKPDDQQAPGPAASTTRFEESDFPWWLVWLVVLIYAIVVNDFYQEAFRTIFPWPWDWRESWNRAASLSR